MSATIHIPGCAEPLVLESREVAWLYAVYSILWRDNTWCGDDEEEIAAVYECALRDMIVAECRERGLFMRLFVDDKQAALALRPFFKPETAWTIVFQRDAPTTLHTLRAAAQYLDVGPWDPNRKDS